MREHRATSAQVHLPDDWSGPVEPGRAAEVAGALAVRSVRPAARHRDDVRAAAVAAAWEALVKRTVTSWAGLRLVARNAALAAAIAQRSWIAESSARRSTAGAPGRPTVVPLDPAGPLAACLDGTRSGDPAPSAALRRLRVTIDRLVDELAGRGLDAGRARELVEVVVEHPELRRGAQRARHRLLDEGLAPIAADALVALVLGYPTRGVPGLLGRELTGAPGWAHPCVPRLLDLVARPRGRRLRGMWAAVDDTAA